jgi:hypothetical protein
MRIGLFIPCYIDAFFPEVGIATLEVLDWATADFEGVLIHGAQGVRSFSRSHSAHAASDRRRSHRIIAF